MSAVELKFPQILTSLRAERGISQRKAASDLGISQALLSHYENGLREPRLDFVVRACDYYGVSADYMLGRSYDGFQEFKTLVSRLAELSAEANRLIREVR